MSTEVDAVTLGEYIRLIGNIEGQMQSTSSLPFPSVVPSVLTPASNPLMQGSRIHRTFYPAQGTLRAMCETFRKSDRGDDLIVKARYKPDLGVWSAYTDGPGLVCFCSGGVPAAWTSFEVVKVHSGGKTVSVRAVSDRWSELIELYKRIQNNHVDPSRPHK